MKPQRDEHGRWIFPYKVPDGVTVFKRRNASARSKWMIAYKPHPRTKRKVEAVSADARATKRRALKIAQLQQEAEVNPRVARYLQQARVPIARHLDDFEKDLLAGEVTAKQAGQVKARAKWVCDHHPHPDDPAAVGVRSITQLSRLGVKQALRKLREKGSGVKGRKPASKRTSNHYLRAVKQFVRFLRRDKRVRRNPVADLAAINWRDDVRHPRQDLGDEAAARLIVAARHGPDVLGFAGADLAMLFETALESGFRGNELATLTPRRCQLDDRHPVLIVKAGYSKHRREDHQPVRHAFAAKLAAYLVGRPADEPIWRVPKEPVDLMLPVLERARDWWLLEAAENSAELKRRLEEDFLEYRDREGRCADFHALRHTYVCRLVRAGVSPKECQVLARHASITTTMDYYAHLRIHDTAGAVNRVPALPPQSGHGAQRQRATGTYGSIDANAGGADAKMHQGAQRDAQRASDASCRLLTDTVLTPASEGPTMSGAQNDEAEGVGGESEMQLAGVEPATFGSVDRRVKKGNTQEGNDLDEDPDPARSAMRSAQYDPALHTAVEKLTAYFKSGRLSPTHAAGVVALGADPQALQSDDRSGEFREQQLTDEQALVAEAGEALARNADSARRLRRRAKGGRS